MLNYIWFGLLALGIIFGIFSGRVEEITEAVLQSGGRAVELCLGLLGIMCLWTGLMRIAEKSGIVKGIAALISRGLRALFPELPKGHQAFTSIVMNLSANFLGLGNAATPLGLKAMKEMEALNPKKGTATNSMCMFLVMNTAAIQLIPTTVIAVRAAAGSQAPADIVGAVWVTSLCSFSAAVISAKLFAITRRRKTKTAGNHRIELRRIGSEAINTGFRSKPIMKRSNMSGLKRG